MTEDTDNRALRLKTLGNAVCPARAYPIFQYIAMKMCIRDSSILCHDFSEAFKTSIMEGKEDSATNFLLTQMYLSLIHI